MKNIIDTLPYYEKKDFELYQADSLELLKKIPDNSIDFIFADPPYFLSNNGITCSGGKMASVNKGDWDKAENQEYVHKFNKSWLNESQRILKKNGSIMISGTYHNIYSIGFALQELDFKILNNITWFKSNPSPNLACRTFTHSTETILWASKNKKSKHFFNYKLMKTINNNKQMRDVWEFPAINKKEKKFGSHPTQKPIKLMERIILAATYEGSLCLDPFNGSGTTGIACKKNKRRYIGIDISSDFLDITINRFEEVDAQITLDI